MRQRRGEEPFRMVEMGTRAQIPCSNAASVGNLEMLKWAREHKCRWAHDTTMNAAQYGHWEILEWAHKGGCECTEDVCTIIAFRGVIKRYWNICTRTIAPGMRGRVTTPQNATILRCSGGCINTGILGTKKPVGRHWAILKCSSGCWNTGVLLTMSSSFTRGPRKKRLL